MVPLQKRTFLCGAIETCSPLRKQEKSKSTLLGGSTSYKAVGNVEKKCEYYKQREMSKKIITNFKKMIFSLLPFHAGCPFSLFSKVVSPVSLIFSGRFSLLPKPFLSTLATRTIVLRMLTILWILTNDDHPRS